jgi:beta-mannosidase
VLDYYGFGKAGYYYVRRAYAPILGSFKVLEDGAVELWITNDTSSWMEDYVTARLGTFAGDLLWEENLRVRVAANSSRPIRRWERSQVGGGADRYLSVRSTRSLVPPNRIFFAAVKDLQRVPVKPEAAVTPGTHYELRVRLQAPGYAYFVHLAVPDEATRFSDNYFDLEPGESRTVVVTNEQGSLVPEMITVR